MKRFATIVIVCIFLLCTVTLTHAATLEVDRNSELDMDHYNVYACFVPSCTVLQNSAMKQAITMLQPAIGIRPSVTIDLVNQSGRLAVSAADLSGNESGLSVSVPFDFLAPTAPSNPVLTP